MRREPPRASALRRCLLRSSPASRRSPPADARQRARAFRSVGEARAAAARQDAAPGVARGPEDFVPRARPVRGGPRGVLRLRARAAVRAAGGQLQPVPRGGRRAEPARAQTQPGQDRGQPGGEPVPGQPLPARALLRPADAGPLRARDRHRAEGEPAGSRSPGRGFSGKTASYSQTGQQVNETSPEELELNKHKLQTRLLKNAQKHKRLNKLNIFKGKKMS